VIHRLVDGLLGTGRPGGAVAIVIALSCLVLTLVDLEVTRGFFLLLPVFGVCMLLVGGVLLVHGNPQGGDFKLKEPEPPSPALLEALNQTPRPFYLCTKCRIIGDTGLCDRCKLGIDCLEIRDDEDLRLALVALS
jgi:hypothetical protein